MAETPPSHPEERPHLHEHSDISARAIWTLAGLIVGLAIIIHLFIYWLFFLYEGAEARMDEERERSAIRDDLPDVPQPRIQGIPGFHPTTPRQDMAELNARNRRLLTSYGPGDEQGLVRVPIERAMELLVERGLPAAPQTRPSTQDAARGGAP